MFLLNVYHKQCYGWWMGQVGKAICEGSLAIDSLHV